MTIILGRELERYGVTVNAISPRARTRMTEDLFGDMAKAEEGKFDAFGPTNVAPLVAFLASDEAADVNGQNFVVFGGSVWVMQGWQAGRRTQAGQRAGRPRNWPTTRRRSSPPTRLGCPPSASSRSVRLTHRSRQIPSRSGVSACGTARRSCHESARANGRVTSARLAESARPQPTA